MSLAVPSEYDTDVEDDILDIGVEDEDDIQIPVPTSARPLGAPSVPSIFAEEEGSLSPNTTPQDNGEGAEDLLNPAPPSEPVPLPTQPPWFEWSDDFINEETWESDIRGQDYFEDNFTAHELIGIKALRWLRPSDIFPEPPSVVKFNSLTLDLISPNAHLCEKSETMRYILSEISELYDYSLQNKFECEGEGVAYVPNYAEDDRRWTPWSHIYSCCKAGTPNEKPIYNPKGKYFVRLYFMGAWRRIIVDDRIPVLPTGRAGLPLTGLNELWPMLLAKALLKVATVTWKTGDVKRFSTISALTGWVYEWIDNIDGVNEEDLWADLENTLPKFKDPSRVPSWDAVMQKSKRRRFGTIETGDTFWWMPNLSAHTSDMDNILFLDYEHEPLSQMGEIVAPPPSATAGGGEPKTIEYKWKQKTEYSTRVEPTEIRIPELITTSADTPEDQSPGAHSNAVATGKKAKKAKKDFGDEASEKKSLGPKKFAKKQKEKLETKKEKGEEAEKEPKVTTFKDMEDETTEEEEEGKLKPVAEKRWGKIKTIVLGGDPPSTLAPRKSHSIRKTGAQKGDKTLRTRKSQTTDVKAQGRLGSAISERLELAQARASASERGSKKKSMQFAITTPQPPPNRRPTRKSFFRMPPNAKIPTIPEILYGVQKYAGIDYRNMVKNWENICGKDSPIALVVVLKCFPKPEDDGVPSVPNFLQHPIQLTEVRDTVLPKPSDRPSTPLWKRFRWKAWAMRKGLIPMEEDRSKEIIHAVKAKTPFIFKSDWYEFKENVSIRNDEEFGGEDDGLADTTFFLSLKSTTTDNTVQPSTTLAPAQLSQGRPSKTGDTVGAPESSTVGDSTTPRLETPAATNGQLIQPNFSQASGGPASKRKEPVPKPGPASTKANPLGKGNLSQMSPTGEKRSSTTEDGLSKGSNTVILHETQIVRGESEEDFDEGARKLSHSSESVVPTSASGTVWMSCEDIAKNLRKFCKFYTSTSIFGSCYILRREPNVIQLNLDPVFQEIHSNLPKYPQLVTEYKQKENCINNSILFDRWKSYHVTNYHLDDKQGIDSGFYLFSDCWTEQELIISVLLLQEEFLKQFMAATTLHSDDMPVPPPTPNPGSESFSFNPNAEVLREREREIKTSLNLNLIIEPWDWRKDCCLSEPLICTTIRDQWIAHVRLPAGRNTFRIWILLQNSESHNKSTKRVEVDDPNEFQRRKNAIPFSVRIVSQTPIYVGSRVEVQNYMTNPPMLFLKQCERLANNLWGLFACFGKHRHAYSQNLKQLRRAYCPAYSEPNLINKFLRGTHDTFEELFVSLITQYNEGKLDRMLVLTLRVLFLNPMLGRQFVPKHHRNSHERKLFEGIFRTLGRKAKGLILSATMTIQKYYRGWRVRRLFHLRNKSHPKFKKIEYNVRKIAFLLARETDSVYSHASEYKGLGPDEPYPPVKNNLTVDPEKVPPTIMPNPPHWAVDLLRFLSEHNPWLITIHPHAYCVPHHVKIQEVEGELPRRMKDFFWYPFFREVLKIPPDSKSCFCEIDLQVFPQTGIYLKIVNNDNAKCLSLVNNRLFLGRLSANKHGYTVLCYRWATFPTTPKDFHERSPSKLWKIRVITPHMQDVPRFIHRDEEYPRFDSALDEKIPSETHIFRKPSLAEKHEAEISRQNLLMQKGYVDQSELNFPKKLCLRRLTGYYIPNKDFSLCRYVLETEEKKCTISLRLRTNYEQAKIRVQVWDCAKKSLIFEETCNGGVIAPCIQLHLTRRRRLTGSLNEDWSRGDLVSSSGLLGLDKRKNSKTSSKASAEKTVNWEAQKEASTSEMGEKVINSKPKHRYIISVFIVDNSWPLTDREWVYVLYKRRKFFKDMRRWDYRDCERRRREREERNKETNSESNLREGSEMDAGVATPPEGGTPEVQVTPTEMPAAPLLPVPSDTATAVPEKQKEEKVVKDNKEDFISAKRKKTKTPRHLADKREREKDADKDKAEKVEGNKDNLGVPPTTVADTNPNFSGPIESSPSTAYPATPPPTMMSNLMAPLTPQDVADKRKQKIKSRCNGSLMIKYGGKQSQDVRHFDQPHWSLEIVTDSTIKYKLKSNRQILRKRLQQAKETWEQGGFERLDRALCHRRNYLLENLVPINYNSNHPFSIVDPMTNLYSCLHLEDYDLNGYSNREYVQFLQKSWEANKEEKQRAQEKLLEKPRKFQHSKIKPYGMEYLPRILRQRVERYREIRREAKRIELNLRRQSSFQEDEDEEPPAEVDNSPEQGPTIPATEVEVLVPYQENVIAADTTDGATGHNSKSKKIISKGKGVMNPAPVEIAASTMKKKPDAPTERQRHMSGSIQAPKSKKLKISSSNNNTTKIPGQEQQAAAVVPPGMVKVVAIALSSQKIAPLDGTDGINKLQMTRLKRCGVIGEILKRYEEFFKQPKTIREGLLDVTKRHQLDVPASKKLVLKRSGISKYCQKLFTSDEHKSRESLVTEKLLNWAYDYSCLQPCNETKEAFEDPGELPSFFLQSILEDPNAEEELESQKNEVRYPLPPPKRPTHVLIGPKMKDCGLINSNSSRMTFNT